LSPSTFAQQNYASYVRIINGNLEILNKRQDGEGYVNFETQGFKVGDTFQILSGRNIGTYTIFAFNSTVLTLTPNVGTTPTYSGDDYFTVKFYYTNVLYVTRTTEGFISNPNGLQNANYTIKRNMDEFGQYFASCLMYEKKDIVFGDAKNTEAWNFTSQLVGGVPVTENANILYTDLPEPLFTPKMFTLNCVAEFEDILNHLDAYKLKRGFIRGYDSNGRIIKGFVQKLDHLWQENKLKLILEEKFQTEYLKITSTPNGIFVEDYPNSLSGIQEWWRFDNDYIILYDNNNRPLNNQTDYRFDFVEVNGIIYPTKAQLITALLSL